MDLKQHIRDVPDFPIKGVLFKDITTLLNNPAAFRHTVDKLAERYRGMHITKIVGVEARGFIFAGALAYVLGCGVIPVRKKGKLPHKTRSMSYELEYGTATIEIHEDSIHPGEQILVLDDVIATGGTLAAACELVEKLGGEVVEVAVVIELTVFPGRKKLSGRSFHALIEF
ncbi:MAG: adenine phosphoribosyltransferase [bacterium]|nr:adenine phosphoribosyltransferase [Candidatus Sumerlaeota bacterium]